MKKKTRVKVLVCAVLVLAIGYLIVGNPIVFMNNRKLRSAITEITADTVTLNEVVPFEWDSVYMPDPYASKENIEKLIGFKSASIKENWISEGMVHLIFVKDRRVVASVLSYPQNLGYSIGFRKYGPQIDVEDHVRFQVEIKNEIVCLLASPCN